MPNPPRTNPEEDRRPDAVPDLDVLRQKIHYVQDTLRDLRGIGHGGKEHFLEDRLSQAAATRMLQVGVEAILDAANHIIARERLGIPKTYAEAITILVREGILPREKKDDLTRMVRFRNRAVHLYDEIDPSEIWRIIEHHLGDFEVVIEALVQRYF